MKTNENEINIFVSTSGNDSWAGTIEAPLATLSGAQNAIHKYKLSGKKISPTTVYLREGIYELNSSFELNEEDSGSESTPLVFKAYGKENVRISGGIQLDPKKFQTLDKEELNRLTGAAQSNVVKYDLKKNGIFDYGTLKPHGFRRPYENTPMELFFNSIPMTLSRWPNQESIDMGEVIDKGSIPMKGDYSNKGGIFKIDCFDRVKKWKNTGDIWANGYFCYGWADDSIKVDAFDYENEAVVLKSPHMFGLMQENKYYNKLYFVNIFEELDIPGEYFIDRINGVLYFWPPESLHENQEIFVSMLEDPMVVLNNVSNVRFENLTFEMCRGMGIYIEGGSSNIISGCTLRNIGIVAVCEGKGIKPDTIYRHNFTGELVSRVLGSWHEHIYDNSTLFRNAGIGHGIENCHIYNTGAGAISLSGGDRRDLSKGNNYVRNCEIHDFNRWDKTYKAGINIDGVGNEVSHCKIYSSSHFAIYLHGNDHLIEYNDIGNVCKETDDGSAIYIGRDPSERGNIIRYNYFHDIFPIHWPENPMVDGMGVFAIYFDDGACGGTILGNVFYKAGTWTILNNGSSDMKIINNLFIECATPVFHGNSQEGKYSPQNLPEKGGLLSVRLLEHLDITQSPYLDKYPELSLFFEDCGRPSRNLLKCNVIYKCPNFLITMYKHTYTINAESTAWYEQEQNIITWKTLELDNFKNFEEIDLDKRMLSMMPDFQKIPFKKIGMQDFSR